MTAREWKPGDKALVEVEVEIADPLAARVTIADDPGYWVATEALRPVPAAGEAATEGGESAALPHTRTPSGGAVMTIHNVRLFWSGYVLTVLNSTVLGACLERMLR